MAPAASLMPMWSPPMRGCSAMTRRVTIKFEVVPADAGMFRHCPASIAANCRGSRRRRERSVQTRWLAVNARHLASLPRAGARFEHGWLVERPSNQAPFKTGTRITFRSDHRFRSHACGPPCGPGRRADGQVDQGPGAGPPEAAAAPHAGTAADSVGTDRRRRAARRRPFWSAEQSPGR